VARDLQDVRHCLTSPPRKSPSSDQRSLNLTVPDEVLLEHCTLGYDLMDLWKDREFKGDLGLGVIDQRSDDIETVDVVRKRVEPALKHFPRERLILTSECGFGHVPLDITRKKLAVLVEASHAI
jgi:5-methyltetrahydropteroyltriglutamate--homocysteine methyltransferase